MRTLNLGILAHVDAGKTTLTERLLYAAGVIDEPGRVDDGNTQTDTLAMERKRGITIRSAVASFVVDDVVVNLIDTPGHPDFIAEVERSLGVLDGVVLVISAVEGVQAQTLVLMRTLQRLSIPTLLFMNKIDRPGADVAGVLRRVRERLTSAVVPMVEVYDAGGREACVRRYEGRDAGFLAALVDVLGDDDDEILATFVDDAQVEPHTDLQRHLVEQTRLALAHPVFYGSAVTGAGVAELMTGVTEFLPTNEEEVDGQPSGVVFKIERGSTAERVAYVRMFAGSLRTRDRLRTSRGLVQKVTAIEAFSGGLASSSPALQAGQIGKVWGLTDIRVGEGFGSAAPAEGRDAAFDPPAFEAVIEPHDKHDGGALSAALGQLAEQDPLINVRHDPRVGLCVSLYGEVQREVLQATLADDYRIEVSFRPMRVICIERPRAVGTAVIRVGDDGNHRPATVGLRIEPAAAGSGVRYRSEVGLSSVPLYIFGTVDAFDRAIEHAVQVSLDAGVAGWPVTDCTVTMTEADYRSPSTSAGDYRHLTESVLARALARAGTVVCEPVHRFRLEIPTDTLGAVWQALGRLGAVPEPPTMVGALAMVEGLIPVVRLQELRRQLAGLTHGEGAVSSTFALYQPQARG